MFLLCELDCIIKILFTVIVFVYDATPSTLYDTWPYFMALEWLK